MGFDFLENYTNNLEAILKKTKAKLKKVSVENLEVSQAKRNLAPELKLWPTILSVSSLLR
jgi:hypothetical protein